MIERCRNVRLRGARGTSKLAFEALECRAMFSGQAFASVQASGVTENSPQLFYAPDGMDSIIDRTFTGPSQEGSWRTVSVNTFGPFSTILSAGGGLELNKVHVLEGGESGQVVIDLKSLSQALAALGQGDPYKLATNYLLGAEVRITTTLHVPHQDDETRTEVFYFSRFISAVEPGTNRLWFPPSNGVSRPVPLSITSSQPWGIIVQSGEPATFSVSSGLITFQPQHKGMNSAPLNVVFGAKGEVAGTITANGIGVANRTWSLDREALIAQLQLKFANGSSLSRSTFETMADQIITSAKGTLGSLVDWVDSLESANDKVTFQPVASGGNAPIGQTVVDPTTPWLLAAHDVLDDFSSSSLKDQFDFAELLRDLRARNANPTSTINLNKVLDPNAIFMDWWWADATDGDAAGKIKQEIVKSIVHEVGHAEGFLGEIIPGADSGVTAAPFDYMQQGGFSENGAYFIFLESAPIFRVLRGSTWYANDLQQAVDLINGSLANGRQQDFFYVPQEYSGLAWTNPRNALDATLDAIISPRDALEIINWLLKYGSTLMPSYDFSGGYLCDTNADGSISPADALRVINHLLLHGLTSIEVGGAEAAAYVVAQNPGGLPESVASALTAAATDAALTEMTGQVPAKIAAADSSVRPVVASGLGTTLSALLLQDVQRGRPRRSAVSFFSW